MKPRGPLKIVRTIGAAVLASDLTVDEIRGFAEDLRHDPEIVRTLSRFLMDCTESLSSMVPSNTPMGEVTQARKSFAKELTSHLKRKGFTKTETISYLKSLMSRIDRRVEWDPSERQAQSEIINDFIEELTPENIRAAEIMLSDSSPDPFLQGIVSKLRDKK